MKQEQLRSEDRLVMADYYVAKGRALQARAMRDLLGRAAHLVGKGLSRLKTSPGTIYPKDKRILGAR